MLPDLEWNQNNRGKNSNPPFYDRNNDYTAPLWGGGDAITLFPKFFWGGYLLLISQDENGGQCKMMKKLMMISPFEFDVDVDLY